jgi:hypothetical protein
MTKDNYRDKFLPKFENENGFFRVIFLPRDIVGHKLRH